jgi:hypothetical protein
MSVPELQERSLGEGSQIRVRYLTGPSSRLPGGDILVIQYAGRYGYGSAGNGDATFMCAMARAGLSAFDPFGMIHDLSELDYEWGDRLEELLTIGPDAADPGSALLGFVFSQPQAASQPAIVVGARSEEAVRTLLLGINSNAPLESIGNVFRDLRSAWAFVDAQIA